MTKFDVLGWYRDDINADKEADEKIRPYVRKEMMCKQPHIHCTNDIVQKIKITFIMNVSSDEADKIVLRDKADALALLHRTAVYFFYGFTRRREPIRKTNEIKRYCLQFRGHQPLESAMLVEQHGLSHEKFRAALGESCDQIEAYLRSLKNDEGLPLLFFAFHGMSYREIAVRLNLAESTVKSRIYNLRKKLADFLDGNE